MDLLTMVLTCNAYADNAIVSAMAQINSHHNPLVISGKPFKTEQQALNYIESLKKQGQSYEIGLMQIPDHALKYSPLPVNLADLLRPCKNMVVATQILNSYKNQSPCNGNTDCALSMYKTGDTSSGLDYADQIIQYASAHPVIPPPPLD